MKHYAFAAAAVLALVGCQEQGAQERSATGQQEQTRTGEQGAYGQEQQAQGTTYGQQPATGQQQQAQAGETSQIEGRVESVDRAQGRLEVAATQGGSEETIRIRATPGQIEQYREGQQVSLRVTRFGENQWLTGTPTAAGAGTTETVSGTVDQIDQNEGTLTLSGTEGPSDLQAHPESLRNVTPGQFVSVTYAEVEGENWVREVQPSAGQQQQGGQEGMQQPQGGEGGMME